MEPPAPVGAGEPGPVLPLDDGTALLRGHRPDGSALEIVLKGGQMGSEDYFGWVRAGGGAR